MYLATQNIPRAVVLTLGNKVVLSELIQHCTRQTDGQEIPERSP